MIFKKATLLASFTAAILAGSTLANDDEKITQAQEVTKEVENDPVGTDLAKLVESLGITENQVEMAAESLSGENGEMLFKMGAEMFSQMLSANQNRSVESGSAQPSPQAAGLSSGGATSIDLMQLMTLLNSNLGIANSSGAEAPAQGLSLELTGALVAPNGVRIEFDFADIRKAAQEMKKLFQGFSVKPAASSKRFIELGLNSNQQQPGESVVDPSAKNSTEALQAISEQMEMQTKLLMKLLEKIEE